MINFNNFIIMSFVSDGNDMMGIIGRTGSVGKVLRVTQGTLMLPKIQRITATPPLGHDVSQLSVSLELGTISADSRAAGMLWLI